MKRIIQITLLALTLMNGALLYASEGPIYAKNVPAINQMPEMPTGCEATALTMILNYDGYKITKQQVAKDMPKTNPVWKNGKLYAAHPNQAFYGNPFSSAGYGVYSPVIANMIEKYLPGRSDNLTGKSFNEVLNVVKEGRPVVVWATMGLRQPYLTASWVTPEGAFRWKAGEHALVIVGYDNKYVYVNDPLKGKQVSYDRALFEKRYNEMGKMAVAIKEKYIIKDLTINDGLFGQSAILVGETHLIPVRAFANILNMQIEVEKDKLILTNSTDQFEIETTNEALLKETLTYKTCFINNTNYIDLKLIKEKTNATISYTDQSLSINYKEKKQEKEESFQPEEANEAVNEEDLLEEETSEEMLGTETDNNDIEDEESEIDDQHKKL